MTLSEEMARSLQLPESFVIGVAHTASRRYKEFQIPKADGRSMRRIEQPSKELKLLQRWLVRKLFDRLPTHDHAHAYVRGRSIVTNASAHRANRYLSRLDFQDFFPSLTSVDVGSLLSRSRTSAQGLTLADEDVRFVSDLVCRFGRLTIGAPSSPTISNKLLYELDAHFSSIAGRAGAVYTRYADDLYFSSSGPGALYGVCAEAEKILSETTSPRLRLNERKTYHASKKKRMAITGLRITQKNSLSVGRGLKRKIRAVAHRASVGAAGDDEREWLRGMLAYISSVEPWFAERVRSKYEVR